MRSFRLLYLCLLGISGDGLARAILLVGTSRTREISDLSPQSGPKRTLIGVRYQSQFYR